MSDPYLFALMIACGAYLVWRIVPWACLRRGHCGHATGKMLAESRITHERGVYAVTVEETTCCRCESVAWRERAEHVEALAEKCR